MWGIRPFIALSIVDFPLPLRPASTATSPSPTVKVTWLAAGFVEPAYVKEKSLNSTATLSNDITNIRVITSLNAAVLNGLVIIS